VRKLLVAAGIVTLALAFLPQMAAGHGEHVSLAVEGTFSTTCGQPSTSHHAREDPVVFPGQTNVGHLHEFFGNNSTNAFSTYSSMVAATTDCNFKGDTAGYWVPALIAPDGTTYTAYNHWVYYRDFRSNPNYPDPEISPFPPNLRMITDRYYWRCKVNGVATDSASLNLDCDPGSYLTFEASFQRCWDGVHLDSADHRSHVSFPVWAPINGQEAYTCPAAFPVRLPGMSVFGLFVPDGLNSNGFKLSSDIQAGPGTVPGTTMHADFWNTWQQSELERITQVCLVDHGDIPESPNYTDANGNAYDPSCLQADSKFVSSTPTPTPTPAPTPPPPNPTPLERFCAKHPDHQRCG
jgi:hypothetical protein